ncbi:hypothetical protein BGZ68_000461 [Mortierella alpina]|nr:hypothetical protein BGZ68_000461 [Mortierella alpina]
MDTLSLTPASAHLVTQLVKCVSTIESAGPKQVEDWETVQARRQAEDILNELQRLVIPLSKRLRYAAAGIFENQALYLAVNLGIAQALVDAGPDGADVDTLASCTGTVADSLERILRVLQASDVAVLHENRWSAGEAALSLCPNHARSAAAGMDFYGNEIYTAVGFLGHQVAPDRAWPVRQASAASSPSPTSSVHTTQATQACLTGLGSPSLYAHLAANADRQTVFTKAMASWTLGDDEYLAADYPWEIHAGQRLCDVGGADGNFFKHLLAKHPSIAGGTIYDISVSSRPAGAPEALTYTQGNFLETVPAGHQVYFMRHIVHNWDGAHVRRILGNIRQAMAESLATENSTHGNDHGKSGGGPVLLIAEAVVTDKVQREVAVLDLVMLTILPGAKERTVEEYSTLCRAEGLCITRVWPTRGKHSILEVRLDPEAKMKLEAHLEPEA